MKEIITYRRLSVTVDDISIINKIIYSHPNKSRRFISQEICRVFNWRQANNILKDMVCRSFLLILESKDLIKLPPRKFTPPNPLANRKKPSKVIVDQSIINCSIKDLFPIKLVQVRRTIYESTFNSLISEHHYLGYTQPVGEHLKYIAFSHDRPIACLAWSSAPWYIGDRDRYIQWTKEIRQKNLHLIANNTRFLILPWIQVSCLASHILSMNRQCLSNDWQKLYNHPIHLVETFVDTQRYKGICYIADNWRLVGQTTGFGKLSKSKTPTLSKKEIFVYPLTRNFRQELCQ
jgi:hypothetical protein